MYKQYLASLHKLGKRDVISAQHYAACVRTVFGGSVGPNQRTLQNRKVDKLFEGIRVRAQPLPLKLPPGVQIPMQQQQQQQQQQQPQQQQPPPLQKIQVQVKLNVSQECQNSKSLKQCFNSGGKTSTSDSGPDSGGDNAAEAAASDYCRANTDLPDTDESLAQKGHRGRGELR